MMLVDTNVYVNAFRPENDRHTEYRSWLDDTINGLQAYAVADFVINGFIRIVTNPRAYKEPASIGMALEFAGYVRNQPHAIVVTPGERHWEIFSKLCGSTPAIGKLVPDAYLAALAIEHGCEFVTCDGDFAKFPGLRWRHPLD
ncbi:type II toxin-antitoxin system VapC family toxin [Microtetraspora sp. NBRC 16547]|uniref:type II toxin-antitoxin system VapC family toxin n=1 Tax=Microtetraspora sp. NBRC 16547 TaxID=3030993 RepID=UPI0024A0CD8E|nr:type II toxin-antitoxin system VapC family toxin [Microtetraspora sp. NBRC 16547]GLX01791.1 VapC ribonuclease [Microtetraspora sp. NBRC 16547]